MEDNNANNKVSKKKIHKKKTIISIIGVVIVLFLIIVFRGAYERNKILKFDSNIAASYATYAMGVSDMVANSDSYTSQSNAKQLIVKGIDIAKNNEKNVPKSLKENYEEYIRALEQYSIDLNDNGEVNSYAILMENRLKDLNTRYNISDGQIQSQMVNILRQYDIEYNIPYNGN